MCQVSRTVPGFATTLRAPVTCDELEPRRRPVTAQLGHTPANPCHWADVACSMLNAGLSPRMKTFHGRVDQTPASYLRCKAGYRLTKFITQMLESEISMASTTTRTLASGILVDVRRVGRIHNHDVELLGICV